MQEQRQDPERLLQAIENETLEKSMGRLKIFFGYAAGVGKTYTMLEAAHDAKKRGVDVVCGYIEPHARPNTSALLEGLEILPFAEFEYNGIRLKELDLDKALERKPELILVDELAHTNAKGARHAKRYQDIRELLKAGIDVYTTVNVQHIESLNDQVAAITGVIVRERIPDSVFDAANQVELVDIEPSDLISRLQEGVVYGEKQAKSAMNHFFTVENLTALREIALRRQADRVNQITENARIRKNGDYYVDEHILVCLSGAPSNAKIIRTAARMATAFHSRFTALYVETSASHSMKTEDKKRLQSNIHLATQLGAKVETVVGEDISYQIVEFARLSGVSKLVLGRSNVVGRRLFHKQTLTDRIISAAPNLDIYIIPDSNHSSKFVRKFENQMGKPSLLDMAKSMGILLGATVIGILFSRWGWTESNITSLFILSVLLIAMVTKHYIYGVLSSLVSVFIFNFFFIEPRYTFRVYDPDYMITFVVLFFVATIASSMTVKLKNSAVLSSIAAYRTKILFDTNQILQQGGSPESIMESTARQLNKLLNKSVIMYGIKGERLGEPKIYGVEQQEAQTLQSWISPNEQAVAQWVYKNNKQAGAMTNTLSNAKCRYLAIRTNQMVYGVVGIVLEEEPLESFQNSIVLSVLGECALALENKKNMEEKEKATMLAQNEQLRSNLLRVISHDLRTPLTSISGNASNLISNWKQFDDEVRTQLFTDIYDDSMWLINLVENLLSVTRLEEGRLKLNFSTELLEDIVEEALKHTNRLSKKHFVHVELGEELLFVNVDAKLIVQVMINILDNAFKYTPENSDIVVSAKKEQGFIQVSVADHGSGVSEEFKEKVFERFFCCNNTLADSRRSMGIGLSLCQSIVKAHGGNIWVSDNQPTGAIFSFTLPAQEVEF